MESSTPGRTRRLAKNTLLLYVRMIVLMLVTLYTSRIVLDVLGEVSYGVYGIVGGVVVLFTFLNNAMSSATQRFISFELGRGDEQALKRVFSASMTIHIAIAIVIFLLAETIGLWFLNTYLNIPDDKMVAANWVYQFSVITFCLQVVNVPYISTIIAYEKMSFFAYIGIIEGVLKLAVAVLLVHFFSQKLIMYGAMTMLVSVIVFIIYRFYSIRKFASVTKYYLFWEPKLYKKLLSFSGWSILGGAANMSAAQGLNILLNIFFGVTVNTAVSIANQVNGALNSFVSNFQTAFKPQIVKSYASNDTQYLFRLINQTSRYSFLLIYTLAIPLIFNMDFALNIWLKKVPEYAVIFCQLILVESLFNALSGPLWMVVQATGRIRNYQIIISSIVVSNLIISYVLLKQGFAPQTVFIVKLFISLICFVVRVVIVSNMIKLNLSKFLNSVVLRTVVVVVVSLIPAFYLNEQIFSQSFASLGSIFALTALVSLFVGMTKSERSTLIKFISKK